MPVKDPVSWDLREEAFPANNVVCEGIRDADGGADEQSSKGDRCWQGPIFEPDLRVKTRLKELLICQCCVGESNADTVPSPCSSESQTHPIVCSDISCR